MQARARSECGGAHGRGRGRALTVTVTLTVTLTLTLTLTLALTLTLTLALIRRRCSTPSRRRAVFLCAPPSLCRVTHDLAPSHISPPIASRRASRRLRS